MTPRPNANQTVHSRLPSKSSPACPSSSILLHRVSGYVVILATSWIDPTRRPVYLGSFVVSGKPPRTTTIFPSTVGYPSYPSERLGKPPTAGWCIAWFSSNNSWGWRSPSILPLKNNCTTYVSVNSFDLAWSIISSNKCSYNYSTIQFTPKNMSKQRSVCN